MKYLTLLLLFVSLMFGAVNINNASVKELTKLKGIGIKKAEAIVNYRKKHCFKSVDELLKIQGIGKKTLEKNKNDIKIGECRK